MKLPVKKVEKSRISLKSVDRRKLDLEFGAGKAKLSYSPTLGGMVEELAKIFGVEVSGLKVYRID